MSSFKNIKTVALVHVSQVNRIKLCDEIQRILRKLMHSKPKFRLEG